MFVHPLLWQSLGKTPFLLSGHLLLKDPLSPILLHGLVVVWLQVLFCLLLLITTPLGGWTQTLYTYSGTVQVYSLANNATVSWGAHTLPQWELVCSSAFCMIICFCCSTACIKTCIIAHFCTVYIYICLWCLWCVIMFAWLHALSCTIHSVLGHTPVQKRTITWRHWLHMHNDCIASKRIYIYANTYVGQLTVWSEMKNTIPYKLHMMRVHA